MTPLAVEDWAIAYKRWLGENEDNLRNFWRLGYFELELCLPVRKLAGKGI